MSSPYTLTLYPDLTLACDRSPAGGAPTPGGAQYVLTGDVQDFTPEDNADFYANPADVDDRGIVANLLGPDGLPGERRRVWQGCGVSPGVWSVGGCGCIRVQICHCGEGFGQKLDTYPCLPTIGESSAGTPQMCFSCSGSCRVGCRPLSDICNQLSLCAIHVTLLTGHRSRPCSIRGGQRLDADDARAGVLRRLVRGAPGPPGALLAAGRLRCVHRRLQLCAALLLADRR